MPIDQEMLYKLVGARLKIRRVGLQYTQAELATKLKISRASIANIEAGQQNAPVVLLYELCSILKIQPSELFPTIEEISESPFELADEIAREMEKGGNTKAAQVLTLICRRHALEDDE